MIHRKKNHLLYKYATCLCLALWVVFLVVLFLLALSLGLWSVLSKFQSVFRPSSIELFFFVVLFYFVVLFFLAIRRAAFPIVLFVTTTVLLCYPR